MSYMRDCEYVESNDAYKEAEKLSALPPEEFYEAVKEKARQVLFQMERHSVGIIGRNGRWERWTNGQDPIWSTYHGYVTWKGTAVELLSEIA